MRCMEYIQDDCSRGTLCVNIAAKMLSANVFEKGIVTLRCH